MIWGRERARSLHIATTLPPTALPKERYPVMATSTYKKVETPILAVITAVVLNCELLPISFRTENIWKTCQFTYMRNRLVDARFDDRCKRRQ